MKQCKKCPWKVTADPHDIPGGYCEAKHRNLQGTIAAEASFANFGSAFRAMACHESQPGKERMCAGWAWNQLGPGNNIALRYRAIHDPVLRNIEVDGEQHERFEDTLPQD